MKTFCALLEMQNPSIDELFESMNEVIIYISRLAASRATKRDLQYIETLNKEMENFITERKTTQNFSVEFMMINYRFQLLCAEAAKNNIMLVTMQILGIMLLKYSQNIPVTIEYAKSILDYQENIFLALKYGDEELAVEFTKKFLILFKTSLRNYLYETKT